MALTSDFRDEYTGTRKEYPQLSEGVQNITVVEVRPLGMKETQWGPKRKVLVKWTGEEKDAESNPITIVKVYTHTMGAGDKPSYLRVDTEAILGQKLTDHEARLFDLEQLLGKTNPAVIEHTVKGDKTYANVAKILKPKAAKGVMTEAEVLAAKEMFTT
jgi:hypothetical protein